MREVSKSNPENALEIPFVTSEALEHAMREGGIWNDLTEMAMQQVATSHGHRYRDSGRPYPEEHIYPITLNALTYLQGRRTGLDEQREVAIAGLLHDTVEDDEAFEIQTVMRVYGRGVSRLVYPLTKFDMMNHVPPGGERRRLEHALYISKLMNAPKNAQKLKCWDRENNLLCSLLLIDTMPDKLLEYTLETQRDYLPLANLLLDKSFYARLSSLVSLSFAAMAERGMLDGRIQPDTAV